MKVISVISGKGGVGKTTTVANLCAALTLFKKRVIAIDGNISGPNLGLQCGVYSSPYDLIDVLNGEVPIEKTICECPNGLRIIPAPISLNIPDVSLANIKSSLFRLYEEFVLVDSSPGLGKEIYPTLEISDEVLVVTNPEIPAVTEALRAVELCRLKNVPVMGVVLNRIRNEKGELPYEEVRDIFDIPILAAVPEDPKVREAIAEGVPVIFYKPYSGSAIEFKRLGARIAGILEYEYKPGILGRIRDFFRVRKRKTKLEELIEEKKEEIKKEIEEKRKEVEQPIMEEEPEFQPSPTPLVVLRANRKVIETALEKLEKRFIDGQISEETYKNLKEKFSADLKKCIEDIARFEKSGGDST
jgi:septum site-determining protein MinD